MSEITNTGAIGAQSSASANPAQGLSQIARVVDTFVAPSKTFLDIRRSSSWWLPFLISLIFTSAFFYAVEKQVGWEQVVENVMKQSPKMQEKFAGMEPTQVVEGKRQLANTYRYFGWGSPVVSLLIAAICAAVLLATINFGFGGEASFGEMFAVWMYGSLPLSIKGLLATAVLFAGMSPEEFNLQNPVGTNLGYYLPPDTNKGLMVLATSLDVIGIWSLILLVIGCAVVGKVKKSSAAIAVFGWWILVVLGSTALALVNS